MDIPTLLEYYKKVVFDGDLEKLTQIGEASEKELARRVLNAQMATPSVTTSTSS